MNINQDECSKNFRCWECDEICPIKLSLNLPEEYFMRVLKASGGPIFSAYILSGSSVEKAREEVAIQTLTLYTSRKKFLELTHK